jgi:hypothetical protein
VLRVADVTVSGSEPDIPKSVAVIEVLPALLPVTTPWVRPTLLTCAIVLSPEVQPTRVVPF